MTNTSFYSDPTLPKKHNHVEIIFEKFRIIYNDPKDLVFQIIKGTNSLKKRFSCLGPEPFELKFDRLYTIIFKREKKILKFYLIKDLFLELEIYMLVKFYS